MNVKGCQSCPTLCNPMGYTVHVILQARILEWVAVPFSRGSSKPRDRTQVSCIAGRFFATEPSGKPNPPYDPATPLLGIFHEKTIIEKDMYPSVLAWRIPGTGEPGGLPSMGSHRVRHDWSNLAAAAVMHIYGSKKMVPNNFSAGQQ